LEQIEGGGTVTFPLKSSQTKSQNFLILPVR
jgi:hypothetical protein